MFSYVIIVYTKRGFVVSLRSYIINYQTPKSYYLTSNVFACVLLNFDEQQKLPNHINYSLNNNIIIKQ